MSLLGKSLLAMVIAAAGAITVGAPGVAHAVRGNLYAAIAVGDRRVGEAKDYPDQFAADQAALDSCEKGVILSCRIKARIHNACGSVVERDEQELLGTGPDYFVGVGYTAAGAEQDAQRRESSILNMSLTKVTKPAFVLDTICTSNVR
jgi:hypothetical protein